MNNNSLVMRNNNLLCPTCGHPLIITKIDGMETLYCQKCKEEIYEEDIYESRREQTYKNNNRRKSLEFLLQ